MIHIAIEGLDGCGKSTQVRLLADLLSACGKNVCVLPLYKEDASERMLSRIDKISHVSSDASRYTVCAKLQLRQDWKISQCDADVIIYDKYLLTFISTEIARAAPKEELEVLLDGVRPADLSIVLSIPPKVAIKRIQRRGSIGYRESGLDVANKGKPLMTIGEFQESPPNAANMEAYFLAFQDRASKTLNHLSSSGPLSSNGKSYFSNIVDRHIHVIDAEDSERSISKKIDQLVKSLF